MSLLKRMIVATGLGRLIGGIYGGLGAILVLHRVTSQARDWHFEINRRNAIEPKAFVELLETLKRWGVEIVTIDEAMERIGRPRDGRFVCLTFDDGYRDNFEIVLPIITQRAVPVTVFATPGLIDGSSPLWWYGLDEVVARETRLRLPMKDGTLAEMSAESWPEKEAAFAAISRFMLSAGRRDSTNLVDALAERYRVDFGALGNRHMMDWAMLRSMSLSLLVEIGAHTLSHPSLANLDAADATYEIDQARHKLEAALGKPVRHLAYPYGYAPAISPRELRLAALAGYRTAVTTAPGNLFPEHRNHPHALPRHGFGPQDGSDALWLKLAGLRRFGRLDWRPFTVHPLITVE